MRGEGKRNEAKGEKRNERGGKGEKVRIQGRTAELPRGLEITRKNMRGLSKRCENEKEGRGKRERNLG